ncbi:60S ribosomal protein L38 [Entamoeba marina]
MPKQVKDIKHIVKLLKSGSVRSIRIKNNSDCVKFKVRCSKYLYTYVCTDKTKVADLKKAIPKDVHTIEINNKKPKAE